MTAVAERANGVASALCVCKHAKLRHEDEGMSGMCSVERCDCYEYRVAGGVVVAPQPVVAEPAPVRRPDAPMDIMALLRAGKASDYKRSRALAEKIAVLVHDLRGRLADERQVMVEAQRCDAEQAKTRAKIAELEAELARQRTSLRPSKPKAKAAAKAAVPQSQCPDCPTTTETPAALGSHRYHKHGYRSGR